MRLRTQQERSLMASWQKSSCICCAQNCGLELEIQGNRKKGEGGQGESSQPRICVPKRAQDSALSAQLVPPHSPAEEDSKRFPAHFMGSGPRRDRGYFAANCRYSLSSILPTWVAVARDVILRLRSVCASCEAWGRVTITVHWHRNSRVCSGATAACTADSI